MAIPTYPMILQSSRMIAPNVKHFALTRADGQSLSFIPGQFITLLIPHEGDVLRRSYSIASIQGKDNTVDFAASYVPHGPASDYLFTLEPGAQVEASGPFGRLILRDETVPRYVLIATGTGVTPYRSMLPELAKRLIENPQLRVVILQGVQKRENLLYPDDFLDITQQHPDRFQFQAFLSRESVDTLQAPHEHVGYVQSSFPSLQLDPTKDIVYLCGNPNMIDDAFAKLTTLGFPSAHVRREKYISGK